ncbi:MAG: efflux RND transporter permease subunit [Myxococcota bacterium]|jgi:multidrug efflux pump subunit AcrB|nr:efflux RND transporter permease subunit [Myxococcota bacterium]
MSSSNDARSKPERSSQSTLPLSRRRSPTAFMAQHPVAANLLMALLLLGGIAMTPLIKQEVFPEVSGDRISIDVVYPGGSPEEVEKGVVLAIEEAVSALDGVDRVRSTAAEGLASVQLDLDFGADAFVVLNDVQAAVDRITSFPADAERPVLSVPSNRTQIISVVLYGDTTQTVLRDQAEAVRRELLALPEIEQRAALVRARDRHRWLRRHRPSSLLRRQTSDSSGRLPSG